MNLGSLLITLQTTSRQNWINMEHNTFITQIVEPLNMIGHDSRVYIISQLNDEQFKLLSCKCWDEQTNVDIDPNGDSGETEAEYNEHLPITFLLYDITSIRLSFTHDIVIRQDLSKQLALLNLIITPENLCDIAANINLNRQNM